MREEEFEIAIKVVIVGNGAVGKSSMIQRYCKGIFTKDYKKTIGVDFLERELEFDGEEIRLMLWDTAGQEEFDAITKAYYRGAQACVLTYSTTDRASFEAIGNWKNKVENEVGQIPMVLVQNKIDLQSEARVHDDEAEGLAKQLKLRLYKTSVKENLNIDTVFEYLIEKHLAELSNHVEDSQPQVIGASLFSFHAANQHSDSSHHSLQLSALGSTEFSQRNQDGNTTIVLHPSSKNNSHRNKKKEKCAIG